MKIDSPFIFCPHCRDGYSQGLLCEHCNGSTRIYFQYEPGFVTRFRTWWDGLHWKTQTVIEGVLFWSFVLLAVALVGWLDQRWPR